MSGVIYDRNRIPAESIGGLEEGDPVTMASGSHNAVLVDLSGYGLEAVLGLHVHSQGAVAIHAGPGIPYAALMHPIPSVEDIHQVAALRPVSSVHENTPPQ